VALFASDRERTFCFKALSRRMKSKNVQVNEPLDESNSSWEPSALHQLLLPDGYYTYLNVPQPKVKHSRRSPFSSTPSNSHEQVDVDAAKRNYRKLSLKHHPDRRNGDAETFRVLARAKKVLTTPNLRAQYDLLGVDLDDDEAESGHEDPADSNVSDGSGTVSNNDNGEGNADGRNDESDSGSGTDTILSTIASAVLAFLLQIMVRVIVMALVSCFISRYKFVVYAAWLFLGFVAYRVRKAIPDGVKRPEVISLVGLGLGLWCMYAARRRGWTAEDGDGLPSFWIFWIGEVLVMSLFLKNSFPLGGNVVAIVGIGAFSSVLAIILRGLIWRYITLFLMVGGTAIVSVIVFPILDMLLEEIINEKMRKVGDKVRQSSEKQEEEMSRLRALCCQLQKQANGGTPARSSEARGKSSNMPTSRSDSLHEMD
jgi:hypothetical protein